MCLLACKQKTAINLPQEIYTFQWTCIIRFINDLLKFLSGGRQKGQQKSEVFILVELTCILSTPQWRQIETFQAVK